VLRSRFDKVACGLELRNQKIMSPARQFCLVLGSDRV
jgi:hypothetical protein